MNPPFETLYVLPSPKLRRLPDCGAIVCLDLETNISAAGSGNQWKMEFAYFLEIRREIFLKK